MKLFLVQKYKNLQDYLQAIYIMWSYKHTWSLRVALRHIIFNIFKVEISKVHKIKRNSKYETFLVPCIVKGNALLMRQDKFCTLLIQRAGGHSVLALGSGVWKSWQYKDGGWEKVRTFQRRQFIKNKTKIREMYSWNMTCKRGNVKQSKECLRGSV